MFNEIEFSICAASSTRFIKHSSAQDSPFILYFKMADLVTLVVLNELMGSDDEKPQRIFVCKISKFILFNVSLLFEAPKTGI